MDHLAVKRVHLKVRLQVKLGTVELWLILGSKVSRLRFVKKMWIWIKFQIMETNPVGDYSNLLMIRKW